MIGRVDESPADRDHQEDDGDLRDDDEPLTKADSLVPRMSSSVSRKRMNTAGMFMMPWTPRRPRRERLERRVAPLIRHVQPEVLEHLVEVLAPGDRDGGGADGVLEHEIPADDPGHQLAHRRVGIGVGAARDRDHRRELGVAEAGEGAADPATMNASVTDGPARSAIAAAVAHEEAGADDGADAEPDEVQGAEGSLEARLAALAAVGQGGSIDGRNGSQPRSPQSSRPAAASVSSTARSRAAQRRSRGIRLDAQVVHSWRLALPATARPRRSKSRTKPIVAE